jgi:hypothetical protein
MVERASAAGREQFRISIGRGDAAESSLPFGVIDQALRGLGFRSPIDVKASRRSPPQARAARLYAALQFLDELPSPALLLLDDLHWADEDSLALLSFICRRISNLPIALIGTLRPWPHNALETVGPLINDGDAMIERLQPLSDASSAEMLNDRAGGISSAAARDAASRNPMATPRARRPGCCSIASSGCRPSKCATRRPPAFWGAGSGR